MLCRGWQVRPTYLLKIGSSHKQPNTKSHLIEGGFFVGVISMSHYKITNSRLYGRALGGKVTKELQAYSLETLQKRANNGNAEAKRLIQQLKDKQCH